MLRAAGAHLSVVRAADAVNAANCALRRAVEPGGRGPAAIADSSTYRVVNTIVHRRRHYDRRDVPSNRFVSAAKQDRLATNPTNKAAFGSGTAAVTEMLSRPISS